MTFWGTEVKPGHPFTLKYEDLGGKLILTQATLGTGSSSKKSILQCNVGDKAPVFLCSLLPEKSECCPLNLEFEEEDDVKFSVVGPTTIHLSGFVQEDVEESDGDGCEYDAYGEEYGEDIADTDSEGSDYDSEVDYSDDDDIMYSPSHVPNSGVVIEEIEDDEKAPSENAKTKQQKKKNQPAALSNEKALVVKGNHGASELESEDEDGFPVSLSHKSEPSTDNQGKKNKKNGAKVDDESVKSLKRKVDAVDEELKRVAGEELDSAGAAGNGHIEIKKKNKKKKKGKTQETEATEVDGVAKTENVPNLNGVNGNVVEKKKNKAKLENEVSAVKKQDSGAKGKKITSVDESAKQSKTKVAKPRTFPNGFVIEDVQMGKPNGKRASAGSKVSVRYIGKLQKSGKQFDSNIGRAPLKFRLGVGQVIKGWDVGVVGMRVGDKRRLIVPPSMGYGGNGAPPQIPPNAWLLFDVELVDVA